MAGVRSKPNKKGFFQGWYFDHLGKRIYFKGTKDMVQTLRIAGDKESIAIRIKEGDLPLPKTEDTRRPLGATIQEYMEWGKSVGGLRGKGWSNTHENNRRQRLAFWVERLGVSHLHEINLSAVEGVLRDLQKYGRKPNSGKKKFGPMNGKSLAGYVEVLRSFLNWCLKRDYLAKDPVKNLVPFDTTPQRVRRALTIEEINRLLAVAPPERALLYRVALCTGLRRSELRALTAKDFSAARCELRLGADYTKNRKAAVLPLPTALVNELKIAVSGKKPDNALLHVPVDASVNFNRDRERAGIPKELDGVADLHCLRTTYISLLLAGDASPFEVMKLARHSDPRLTFETYGRTSREKLQNAAEGLGKHLLKPILCVAGVLAKAAGAEGLSEVVSPQGTYAKKIEHPHRDLKTAVFFHKSLRIQYFPQLPQLCLLIFCFRIKKNLPAERRRVNGLDSAWRKFPATFGRRNAERLPWWFSDQPRIQRLPE
jgi:integrase